MSVTLVGRKVFLASPGGLDGERKVCRRLVQRLNEELFEFPGTAFKITGWEGVPGGIGRPQGLINPEVRESDFMILIMSDRWGSQPSAAGQYSSGTEEEFHLALELLNDSAAPMRDVLVLFRDLPRHQLSDPGDQLKRVLRFRAALEETKAIYFEVFDSEKSMKQKVERRLRVWSALTEKKAARQIVLPVVELPDISNSSRSELLEIAIRQAEAGQAVRAELAFARAAESGDPRVLTEFSKWARRWGRPERSIELGREALSAMLAERAGQVRPLEVRALANIGVTQRALGRLRDSAASLREAKRDCDNLLDDEWPLVCYVLDNLGLTLMRTGSVQQAVELFEEASRIREAEGEAEDRAQSLINLARAEMILGDYSVSAEHFRQAISLVPSDAPTRTRANALCGAAEGQMRSGSPQNAAALLLEALEIDEALGDLLGQSVARGLLGRLALSEGDNQAANAHALACIELSNRSSNPIGTGIGQLLLAEARVAAGEHFDEVSDLVALSQDNAATGHGPLLGRDIDEFITQQKQL